MNKKILFGSIIAIVLIVLSSFSSVIGKVSSDDELVDFDVEFSGLGKKHTVQLTQQEFNEIESIIDELEKKMETVESREQTAEYYNDALLKLDKYRLFDSIGFKQAKNLVIGNFLDGFFLDFPINFFCFVFSAHSLNGVAVFPLNLFVALGVYLNYLGFDDFSTSVMRYGALKPFRFLNFMLMSPSYGSSYNVRSLGLVGIQNIHINSDEVMLLIGFSGLIIRGENSSLLFGRSLGVITTLNY